MKEKKQQSRPRRGMARVVFLAKEAEFRSLVEAGYPLLSIYEDHARELGIGYPQFTRYVNRYLRDAVMHQRQGTGAPARPEPEPEQARPPQPTPTPPALQRKQAAPFEHDPSHVDPGELI